MPHLQITAPDGHITRYALARTLTTLGSSRECDVVVAGDDVSAHHCTITHDPGRYRLQTVQRAAPVLVQGKRVRAADLTHGDVIVLGGVELVFSTTDPAPVSRTPAAAAAESAGSPATSQVRALEKLLVFSEQLLRPGDLDTLLDQLIDQIVALTRASKGFLVLAAGDASADPDTASPSDYTIRVARNLERQPVDDPEQLLSDKIIRDVIRSREPQIISDAYHDERYQNSLSVINLKLSSVMCTPLIARGELLGLIYVGNDNVRDLFTREQLEVMRIFAAQAALFIKNAKLLNELRSERNALSHELQQGRFGELIGACPQMIEVYKRVEKVAATDITVLVTGETGTGKELIAREIHRRSGRARGPFITVNCGAIPEALIESELFGHVKGSFTGAFRDALGKFQAADKGTLFLDEIGELPLALQVKLLRALQERQVQRVGDSKLTPVDIRIVAATNRDLKQEVERGRFREDLYFRLNVIGVELPALRERGDDVLLIARYLLGRYAKEFGRTIDPATAFDPGAREAILRFAWPGNIRQLENHLKKALVLADGPAISAQDLDLDVPEGIEVGDDRILPLTEARERWQRAYINRVLALNDGNRTQTARDLGVDPRTIFRHLEKESERDEP
jgi:transcriptional regulator with GAF, ATPase, and Fis domain